MKVGIYGGSFDPIHNGHIQLALAAKRQLKLKKVFLVVSPRSPFKSNTHQAPASVRMSLLKKALKRYQGLVASDWEIRRGGVSYTIKTMTSYKRRFPSHDVYLVVGSDVLPSFHKWKSARQLLKLCTIAAGRRPGHPWKRSYKIIGSQFVKLKGTFPDISSTSLRKSVSKRRRPHGIDFDVFRSILKKGLYQ